MKNFLLSCALLPITLCTDQCNPDFCLADASEQVMFYEGYMLLNRADECYKNQEYWSAVMYWDEFLNHCDPESKEHIQAEDYQILMAQIGIFAAYQKMENDAIFEHIVSEMHDINDVEQLIQALAASSFHEDIDRLMLQITPMLF